MKRAWPILLPLALAALWLSRPRSARLQAMPVFAVPALEPVVDEFPEIVLVPTLPSIRPPERRHIAPPPPPSPKSPATIPEIVPDPTYLAPPAALEVAPWFAAGLPDMIPKRSAAPTVPPQRRRHDADIVGTSSPPFELPGAQRIADAIASAVRLEAPVVSSGTFVVQVDSDGRVLDVKLLSYRDGGVSIWKSIARESAERLGGDRFPLGSSKRGARVTVRVTSNLEYPSGTGRKRRFREPGTPKRDEGSSWPWAPKPGPRKSWREEGSWTPLPPDQRGVCAPPEATLPPCDPADMLCPGFVFDVADIGARRVRIVRTQLDVAPID